MFPKFRTGKVSTIMTSSSQPGVRKALSRADEKPVIFKVIITSCNTFCCAVAYMSFTLHWPDVISGAVVWWELRLPIITSIVTSYLHESGDCYSSKRFMDLI